MEMTKKGVAAAAAADATSEVAPRREGSNIVRLDVRFGAGGYVWEWVRD
jgi:hypothetical protein